MRRKMTKGMTKGSSAPRRSGAGILALLLVLPLLALFVGATPARAWWNDEWLLRKKIVIDTSAAGAGVSDPIGTSPVLLRLHVGNFRFEQAKEDGGDLRFVAADDKTPLKHHFEKYDSLLGEALVWVSIPDLKPGAKTGFTSITPTPKPWRMPTRRAATIPIPCSSIISPSAARRRRIPRSGEITPRAPG